MLQNMASLLQIDQRSLVESKAFLQKIATETSLCLEHEHETWWTLFVLGVVFHMVVSCCVFFDEHPQPAWWKQRELTYGKLKRHTIEDPTKLWTVYGQNYFFSGIVLVLGWMLRVALFGHARIETVFDFKWNDMRWFLYLSCQFIMLLVINSMSQTWFYHAHRFVHSVPWLYEKIHKMHHEYTEPTAMEAIYCTKLEMVVLNLMAVVIGPWILLPPPRTTMVWYALAATYVPLAHCGKFSNDLLFCGLNI